MIGKKTKKSEFEIWNKMILKRQQIFRLKFCCFVTTFSKLFYSIHQKAAQVPITNVHWEASCYILKRQ
jgi:hypothetical protein